MLTQGHDKSADYWAFGVLVSEWVGEWVGEWVSGLVSESVGE